MDLKYTKGRRYNLTTDKDQVEQIFVLLAKHYNETWLETRGQHPIQKLWQRNDELSSHELYSLGSAIEMLIKIDLKWTNDQINTSKSSDRKNSQGAIFEMLALAIMNHADHPAVPAKANQPGYDGQLKFDDKSLRISIKNYGASESQRKFDTQAKLLEQDIVRLLKKYRYPPVNVLIDFCIGYPEKSDWKLISDHLEGTFSKHGDTGDGFLGLAIGDHPKWTLMIKPLRDPDNEFHEDYRSYTLIITSQYHVNEHKNVFSKIEEACANLSKHSAKETERIGNALALHLPVSASVEQCYKWSNDYFEMYPHKPISIVIFLQPSVVRKDGTSFINHSCAMYVRPDRLAVWNTNDFKFLFTIPVGKISESSAKNIIIAEFPDGSSQHIPLGDKYIHQSGQHYMKMKEDGKGNFYGNMYQPGTGIFVNSIIQLPGQTESVAITGRFQPADELLIL